MIKQNKTTTDLWFENYLKQERIKYEHEPYKSSKKQGKNPDYLFYKNNKKILVEDKEIEKIPFDNTSQKVQSFDPRIYYDVLRDRIDKASRQLKPYKDEVDYCVVILGKVKGYAMTLNDLFFSLYGDPVIKILIRTKPGAVVEKPYFDMKMTGALRRNKPEVKEMIAMHDYISGVGLIRAFNGHQYYQDKVMSPILKDYYNKNKNKELSELIDESMKLFDEKWKIEEKSIPIKYRDKEQIYYRVEIIANPIGKKVIEKGIFSSEWDIVQFPTVINV